MDDAGGHDDVGRRGLNDADQHGGDEHGAAGLGADGPDFTPFASTADEWPESAEGLAEEAGHADDRAAAGPEAAGSQADGADAADDAAPAQIHVGTPHLMKLGKLALELIHNEELAVLADLKPLEEQLHQLKARALVLDEELAAARRDLDTILDSPPTEEDLKERARRNPTSHGAPTGWCGSAAWLNTSAGVSGRAALTSRSSPMRRRGCRPSGQVSVPLIAASR